MEALLDNTLSALRSPEDDRVRLRAGLLASSDEAPVIATIAEIRGPRLVLSVPGLSGRVSCLRTDAAPL